MKSIRNFATAMYEEKFPASHGAPDRLSLSQLDGIRKIEERFAVRRVATPDTSLRAGSATEGQEVRMKHICEHCGKFFRGKPSRRRCSMACRIDAARAISKCLQCGRCVETQKSVAKTKKYCSYICAHLATVGVIRSEDARRRMSMAHEETRKLQLARHKARRKPSLKRVRQLIKEWSKEQ